MNSTTIGRHKRGKLIPLFSLNTHPEPSLANAALIGLAGDFVNTVLPTTESSAPALLSQFLTAVGNVIGRTPSFIADGSEHHPRLFMCLIGPSSTGRKGTALAHVRNLVADVFPEWADDCVKSGLSTGEGLTHHIRDAKDDDPGISDKRLMAIESEFASVLRMQSREGNTLSGFLRNAWDGMNLATLSKTNPTKASDPHVSIIAHITPEELRRHLSKTDMLNGFGNRFLWFFTDRSKLLPDGADADEQGLARLAHELRRVAEFCEQPRRLRRSKKARELWHDFYRTEGDNRPLGLVDSLTARGPAQVVRLQLLYAVLARAEVIEREHLEAAIAVWEYSKDTCLYVFGESFGDKRADRIIRAIRSQPSGLPRTDVGRLFSNHQSTIDIDEVLAQIEHSGLAYRVVQPTTGRPREVWFPNEGHLAADQGVEL